MCLKEVTASGLMIYIYSGFNLSHFLDQNGKDQYTTKHVFQFVLVGSMDDADNIMYSILL